MTPLRRRGRSLAERELGNGRDGLTLKQVVAALIALAAGIAAALSDAAPTGTPGWDRLLVGSVAAGVTAACFTGPRWRVILLAAVAAGAVGFSLWGIVAWVALALAFLPDQLLHRRRWPLAIAAGLAMQALLRLPSFGFFGLPSLIAAIVVVIAVAGAWPYWQRVTRRRVRIGFVLVLAATIVIGFIGGVAMLQARNDVERGIGAAQRGLAAARAGDAEVVAAELELAERALSTAESAATSPPARLQRLLPIASQHQRATEVATREGATIAREAAAAVREADLDSLELVAGSIDLDALARMAPRLHAAAQALADGSVAIGEAESGWLLPSVSSRIEQLLAEAERLRPEAELAADAVDVVPDLLGAGGPRRYFVFFGTAAESREFGGFVGSWATLDAVDGRLELGDSGRINELYAVANGNSLAPGVAPPWFEQMGRPTTYPQNLTSSPDFATVAAVAQEVLDGAFEQPIAGYVYLDAWALIDLLRISGPVEVSFLDEPLTVDNAESFFFEGQYEFQGVDRNDLFDGLAEAANAVLASLSEQTLPGPEELGRLLGPAARAGRLQVVTFDDATNDFLQRVRLLRPFGQTPGIDFLATVQTNGTPSKLDLYLHRDVTYDVRLGDSGSVAARVTVDLASIVPPETPTEVLNFTLGAPAYEGVNRVLLSIYTPHQATQARVNGRPAEFRQTTEFGLWRYLVEAPVAPTGETVSVEFDLVGEMDPDRPYELEIWHQPLVNADDVSVTFRGSDGEFDWAGQLTENLILSEVAVEE